MIGPHLRRLNSILNCGFFKQHLRCLRVAIIENNTYKWNQYEQRNLLHHSNSLIIQPVRAYASGSIKTVTFEDIKSFKSKDTLVIDVREPSELTQSGTLPNSINIPLKKLENVLKSMGDDDFQKLYGRSKPNLDMPLVFSCRSGKRSAEASETALKLGYTNVSNYKGGWLDWEKKNKN